MLTLVSTLLLLFVSCTLAPTDAHAGDRLDLSRLVVVGDSLSAGYQNGSLLDSQQVNGYASVVDPAWNELMPTTYVLDRAGRAVKRLQGGRSYEEFARVIDETAVCQDR